VAASTYRLLGPAELERSSVVANNAMNRERGLRGPNSYARELGFDPMTHLRDGGAWLDLCCGSGRALVEAGGAGVPGVRVVGVDLVDFFADPGPAEGLTLVSASVMTWTASDRYRLITCVHGLHYVGDRLGVLARALSWLTPDGVFAGHLDLDGVRRPDGASLTRPLRRWLREADVDYDPRRRLVRCLGPRALTVPFDFAGADDRSGPNYTGQPAVTACYTNR
jgi:SAM-dependent methyltransferase